MPRSFNVRCDSVTPAPPPRRSNHRARGRLMIASPAPRSLSAIGRRVRERLRRTGARCRSSQRLLDQSRRLIALAYTWHRPIQGASEATPVEAVRLRLARGTLPPLALAAVARGPATGQRCAVCDGAIVAPDAEYEIRSTGEPPVFAHLRCYAVWASESAWVTPPSADDDARVRAIILARLASRDLPRERPDAAGAVIAAGPARDDCAACAKPIQAGEYYSVYHSADYPALGVHQTCDRIWDEERRGLRQSS